MTVFGVATIAARLGEKGPQMSPPFSLSCECGLDIPVAVGDAGGKKRCVCGRELQVPRLSELRKKAGRDPFESGVLDTVRRELRELDDHVGDFCLHSGRPTQDRLWVELICEQKRVVENRKSDRDWRPVKLLVTLFALLTWPFVGISYLLSRLWTDNSPIPDVQEFGHDRSISLPLPVSSEFHQDLSRKKLLKYLKQVPLFSKIFDEYPDAIVRRR